jgi:hypothetical protein
VGLGLLGPDVLGGFYRPYFFALVGFLSSLSSPIGFFGVLLEIHGEYIV